MDGYTIRKGAMLQAPTTVAHYDEAVWGMEDHPASEFWAERHIKSIEEKDDSGNLSHKRVFAMAGRSGLYFPYGMSAPPLPKTKLFPFRPIQLNPQHTTGGGNLICPGRHFIKQEIMTTVGLVVFKIDLEFVKWITLDGAPSDRAPRNDPRYCGSGATPPDHDMKVRIRRLV